jgi:hypothetical protein
MQHFQQMDHILDVKWNVCYYVRSHIERYIRSDRPKTKNLLSWDQNVVRRRDQGTWCLLIFYLHIIIEFIMMMKYKQIYVLARNHYPSPGTLNRSYKNITSDASIQHQRNVKLLNLKKKNLGLLLLVDSLNFFIRRNLS